VPDVFRPVRLCHVFRPLVPDVFDTLEIISKQSLF